jgi:hypothetical protein
MGRACAGGCGYRECSDFSANQWRKGANGRCRACVSGGGGSAAVLPPAAAAAPRYSPYPTGGVSAGGVTIAQYGYSGGYSGGYTPLDSLVYGGGAHDPAQTLKLFHGTSWAVAQGIQRDGFIPSVSGCLGPGVYLGQRDKATRFAEDNTRHQGSAGGLVEVLVTIHNPKYVPYNDTGWQDEGYDACRTDRTSASQNMEWAIRDRSQVAVIRISRVSLVGGPPAEPWFTCPTCSRSFQDAHTLARHQTSHLPKNTSCPLCGETRFRSMSSAVAHVEGGTCSACKGTDNARTAVYQFVQQHSGLLMLGDRVPVLQLDHNGNTVVPDKPYPCRTCGKAFRNLSSQMDHQQAKSH